MNYNLLSITCFQVKQADTPLHWEVTLEGSLSLILAALGYAGFLLVGQALNMTTTVFWGSF